MTEQSISKLIELAKGAKVSAEQRNEQRRSFVFGNTAFENENITRELFDAEAERQPEQLDAGNALSV